MTVDVTTLPSLLGVNVKRVIPETGKPTKFTLDQETAQRQWTLDTAADLQGQVILAQDTADDASAAVVLEATARASGDSANASLIIAAEARVSGGSAATAQIQIAAEANPSGYVASFGYYLRVSGNNYPVGMVARVTSGGVGEIAFLASQFSLTDPSFNGGLPGNVFTYSAPFFRFNVPVLLDTGELAGNAASKIRSNSASGTSTVSIVATDWHVGSEITVLAIAASTQGYSNSGVTAIPTTPYMQVLLDGGLQNQVFVPIALDTRTSQVVVNTVTGVSTSITNDVWWQCPQVVCIAKFNTSSTSHTVTAAWHPSSTNMPNSDWFLVALESKR